MSSRNRCLATDPSNLRNPYYAETAFWLIVYSEEYGFLGQGSKCLFLQLGKVFIPVFLPLGFKATNIKEKLDLSADATLLKSRLCILRNTVLARWHKLSGTRKRAARALNLKSMVNFALARWHTDENPFEFLKCTIRSFIKTDNSMRSYCSWYSTDKQNPSSIRAIVQYEQRSYWFLRYFKMLMQGK